MRLNLTIFAGRPSGEMFAKDRRVSLLIAWLLLCPAVSFAILGDAPVVVYLVLPLLALSVLITSPLPDTARTVIYGLTVATVGTVVLNQVYKIDDSRFFLAAPQMLPFLLLFAASLSFLVQRTRVLTWIAACGVLALWVQGSILNDPANVRLVLPKGFWQDRFRVFAIFVLLQLLALIPLLSLARNEGRPGRGLPVRRRARTWAWLGAGVVLIGLNVLTCVGFYRLFYALDPMSRAFFHSYIRMISKHFYFPEKTSLGETLSFENERELDQVAFYVRAPVPPGYLRGRAFRQYADGTWSGGERKDNLLPQRLSEELAATRFWRSQPGGEPAPAGGARDAVRLEVYPARAFHSDVLFAPGNATGLELMATNVVSGDDGVLEPREWDRGGAYTVFCERAAQAAAFAEPRAPGPEYLEVPEALRAPLSALATEMLAGAGPDTTTKLRRLQDWLYGQCTWSLGFRPEEKRDPVLTFLQTARQGHCELFATAAVLLLRVSGVPARYVTGFVCLEPAARSGEYVARRRDLHAWVEVWAGAERGWVWFEATPASGVPLARPTAGVWDALWEWPGAALNEWYAQIKRGYFAATILAGTGQLGSILAGDGGWRSWLAWAVLAGGAGLLGWRYRRRRRRQREAQPPAQRELRRILLHVEAFLRRRHVPRHPAMTVREWRQLVQSSGLPQAGELVACLEVYERVRYRPEAADPATIGALAQRVRRCLRRSGG